MDLISQLFSFLFFFRALERENDAFNKLMKAEKEKLEKSAEQEIEKETKEFVDTKQRRTSDIKIRVRFPPSFSEILFLWVATFNGILFSLATK